MASIIEHFAALPTDVIYQFFSHLRNINDINNFSICSKSLFRTASDRISHLSLGKITLISIKVILRYRNLKSINNVFIVVDKDNIELINQLPNFNSLNFYLDDIWVGDRYELMIINIFKYIKDLTVTIKIVSHDNVQLLSFIIGDNKIVYLGPNNPLIDYCLEQINNFNSNWQLTSHKRDLRLSGFRSVFPIKSPMLNFLHHDDFGLVDPIQPPSLDNPPLSIHLVKIVQTNTVNVYLLNIIFSIYVIYHQINHGRYVKADQILKKYFSDGVDRYNIISAGDDILRLDHFLHSGFQKIIGINILKLKTTISDINQFTIPKYILSTDDIDKISKIFQQTLRLYRNAVKTGQKTYNTDGSIRTIH